MAYSLANVLNQNTLHIWIWEEDGAFIAKCIDIPGCVSEGDTRDEAIANLREAISACLDVIREDSSQGSLLPAPPDVEVIERPLSDFISAR